MVYSQIFLGMITIFFTSSYLWLHTKHNSLQNQQSIHVYHFLYKVSILTIGHSTQPSSKHHEMQMENFILSTIK
jgi:hypothetical protein